MAPMKIQPIDIDGAVVPNDTAAKAVGKSRLRRLFVFERQLPSVVRTEKAICGGGPELEPSSVSLARMVQSFMEESNEKRPKCGGNRCKCLNGKSKEEEEEAELVKSLIPCGSSSVAERKLLAETAKMVEKNSKVLKRKDDLMRKMVTEGLSSLGYNSSICNSKWDKTPSCPPGQYQFIHAIVEGERFIIDIDFRSQFDIARSTPTYKAILQSLPYIFVGKSDRIRQLVMIVSEAANQSLRKKGMHLPPWRKPDYMLAKWLSPSAACPNQPPSSSNAANLETDSRDKLSPPPDARAEKVEAPAWQPPAVKPKSVEKGTKVVTGLASLLKDKP